MIGQHPIKNQIMNGGVKMVSTQREDILGFIRDFELSSREFLLSKGMTEHEIANAHLELQWKFLHVILGQASKLNWNQTH